MSSDYRSWSFSDRWFWYAMGVSVLWHLFWFFAVTIVVTPPAKRPMAQPRVTVLGPVLDDAIFRTLVESRPEVSKAFYRQPGDFSAATQAPTETLPRYSQGDVVSVPQSKQFSNRLRDAVSGDKAVAEFAGPAPEYLELDETSPSQETS